MKRSLRFPNFMKKAEMMHSLMESPSISLSVDSPSTGLIVVLLLLVVLSAFFSASETAYSSLNRLRIKSRADAGQARARLVLHLVDDYDRLLSCILIANNIVNLSAASIATVIFTFYSPNYGATISTIVLTITILIFGEITPKSLAKAHADRFAMSIAPILRVIILVLTPLQMFFSLFSRLANHMVRKSDDEGITEDELITLVSEAESEGGLDAHESQLIRAAIEFNDLEAEEILTPRVDIVALERSASIGQLTEAFIDSGYSRIPIYEGTVDNIIGIIHEKDFYAAVRQGKDPTKDCIAEVLYSTAGTKISDLLRLFQHHKVHMSVVVDEYGGTLGLVTVEDILEELVGEIWDEHDEVLEEIQKMEDGSYLIACSTDLDDLFERFSLTEDSSDSSSVSGWVMEQLGQVPEEGDHFVYENLDVTVTKVDNRRVIEIRVTLMENETF